MIAVTGGGQLQCKSVYHLSLPPWGHATVTQHLRSIIKSCLERASKEGYQSVALPALGTGQLNYTKDVVAQVMFDTICGFVPASPSSLKSAKIVVYPRDVAVVQAFELQQRRLNSETQPAVSSGGMRKNDVPNPRQDRELSDTVGMPDESEPFSFSIGKLHVTVKQGVIIQEHVDYVVHITKSSHDWEEGFFSKAIRTASLDFHTDDLKKDELKKRGIVVTKAAGLNCKHIIHVQADRFDNKLKRIVRHCFKEVRQMGLSSSIAFHVSETGQFIGGVEEMAIKFTEAVVRFARENPSSSISRVIFIVFQRDKFRQFVSGFRTTLKACADRKSLGQKALDVLKRRHRLNILTDISSAAEKPPQVPDEITLHFYSDDQNNIRRAIKKLEAYLSESLQTVQIQTKNLKPVQINAIKKLEEEFSVKIEFSPSFDHLLLQGLSSDVPKTQAAIHEIQQNHDRADMLAPLVQWCYIEMNSNKKYEAVVNLKIEEAYKKNEAVVKFTDKNGRVWVVDFSERIEYPEDDRSQCVEVVRKDMIKAAECSLPLTWGTMSTDQVNVQLTPGTPEYEHVKKEFLMSVAGVRVQTIERVQTKFLWQQYEAKKNQLEKQNPPRIQNEKTLWHGTAQGAILNICKSGFNRRYCGKNATAFGDGVYFALDASYSARKTYSPPDNNGNRYMFRARVLTGYYTTGAKGMRHTPMRDNSRHIQYDSTTDNVNNPQMFIIFNDTQAYPEYLIKFH